jgi:hypothetical protein
MLDDETRNHDFGIAGVRCDPLASATPLQGPPRAMAVRQQRASRARNADGREKLLGALVADLRSVPDVLDGNGSGQP